MIWMTYCIQTMTGKYIVNIVQGCLHQFHIIIYFSAEIIFHMYLQWSQSYLEYFARPYFPAGENLSKSINNRGANLIILCMNQFVKLASFNFENSDDSKKYKTDFESTHGILEGVERARRFTYRLLGIRLRLFARHSIMTKSQNDKADENIRQSSMLGLSHSMNLSERKIVGAILNPMVQSKTRITAAHLCTELQYEAVMIALEERLICYYESKVSNSIDLAEPICKNEFDDNDVNK